MASKIPGAIRISGRKVRVVLTNPIEFDVGKGRQAKGLCCRWTNTITLDKTLAHDELRAIAVHEILHDLDGLVGSRLTEQDVTGLASVLFAMIRDNPKLIAWLQERK